MKTGFFTMCLFLVGFWVMCTYGATIVEVPPDTIKNWFIEDQKTDKKIIWLDVREDDEVTVGIIASENCRPYHVSWYTDWNSKAADLPRDVRIIIYCRSGVRAKNAALALIDSGYDTNLVAIMAGGYNAYTGTKTTDSSLMKPWSDLPEPSNTMSASVTEYTVNRNHYSGRKTSEIRNQAFNLKGQKMNKSLINPHAPVFILEQIGDTKRQRISGIQRLIQESD